jgi:hypothetical protein
MRSSSGAHAGMLRELLQFLDLAQHLRLAHDLASPARRRLANA